MVQDINLTYGMYDRIEYLIHATVITNLKL